MITIIVAELRGWASKQGRGAFLTAIGFAAAGGALTMLRPELNLVLWAAILIWASLSAGKENWSGLANRDWVENTRFRASQVVCGKVSAALAIGGIQFFMIAPVILFSFGLWGAPWIRLGLVLLVLFPAMGIGATLGFIVQELHLEDKELPLFLMVLIWLGGSALVPGLHGINPILQVWEIAGTGRVMGGNILMAMVLPVSLFALAILLFRETRRENG